MPASIWNIIMRTMQLLRPGQPLQLVNEAPGKPGRGQVLVRVAACGVCRTDLHIVDGDLPALNHPVVPGHEIVGRVAEIGPGVDTLKIDDRVGIPWLGWTCGQCGYCTSGRENLCDEARFTGYQLKRRLCRRCHR
jgi:propanol-preferring alcohol dehydrogenase